MLVAVPFVVLVTVPLLIFPNVEELIDVFVEPEILHAVDIPPFVCTTYGTDSDCRTFNVTAAAGWFAGGWNRPSVCCKG